MFCHVSISRTRTIWWQSPQISQRALSTTSAKKSALTVKADGLIASDSFREGFQERTFLVNSGFSEPHWVICYKSGKTTCTCSFFNRNNLCFHALAIAKHKDRLPGLLKHYPGRNLNRMATNTAPKGVGGKVPPRRKPLKKASTPSRDTCSTEVTEQLCV